MLDAALQRELSMLYQAPDRHYHGLGHIRSMLALADEYRERLADPVAVDAAIWFHDAVYDSRRKDNEALSAAMATEKLAARADRARLGRIEAMIMATATHQLPDLESEAATHDAALFLDMDLAILGAPEASFDAYEQAVRKEYGWVPDDAWRSGRAAVLKSFLGRAHIFQTEAFRTRFEEMARRNLARSLASLSG